MCKAAEIRQPAAGNHGRADQLRFEHAAPQHEALGPLHHGAKNLDGCAAAAAGLAPPDSALRGLEAHQDIVEPQATEGRGFLGSHEWHRDGEEIDLRDASLVRAHAPILHSLRALSSPMRRVAASSRKERLPSQRTASA